MIEKIIKGLKNPRKIFLFLSRPQFDIDTFQVCVG